MVYKKVPWTNLMTLVNLLQELYCLVLLINFRNVFFEVKKDLFRMLEYFFQCPYCWQQISMLLDQSISNQNYIEDCEICCNPIRIKVTFSGSELLEFNAINIEQ